MDMPAALMNGIYQLGNEEIMPTNSMQLVLLSTPPFFSEPFHLPHSSRGDFRVSKRSKSSSDLSHNWLNSELGPLLQEKGKWVIANLTKAEEEQTCPVPQEEEEEVWVLTLPLQACHTMEKMEEFVYKVWEGRHRYDMPPDWLKYHNCLLYGHRQPMPSFWSCFKSIFYIHTETSNIWTHLLGFVLFLFLGILTML
nr:adiponectin receptor protein 1-like [Aotus nancymaae]